MAQYVEIATTRARAISSAVYAKTEEIAEAGLMKIGVEKDDLQKLNKIPLLVSFVGLIVNLSLLLAMSNSGWIQATALSDGQPFTAFLSLGSAKFGTAADPSKDNGYFCAEGSHTCSLGALCDAPDDQATFPNMLPKNTPAEAWCTAARAGAWATTLLWLGLLPGLAAMGFTFIYAAKEIPKMAPIVAKAEELGFSSDGPMQKYIIAGCWGVLWVAMFGACRCRRHARCLPPLLIRSWPRHAHPATQTHSFLPPD
jgi:hypothetical protein